ncbi:MAG: tetratricopeptide repeat protein [Proteobacteria bacterium]|nr:tetratricopeptide repeat protein [Pseudomonadota bacterium]
MRSAAILVLTIGLVTLPLTAHGQSADSDPQNSNDNAGESEKGPQVQPRPWEEGVTPERRKKAEALVGEAYTLTEQFRFEQAAAKYREALESWAHPAIHFTLGKIYINLIKPLEAYRSFQEAVRWGEQPLEQEDYQEALKYVKRLQGQISILEIDCTVPDADVLVDGDLWFKGPGQKSKAVAPAAYEIEVKKEGYYVVKQSISLFPGKKAVITPNLMSIEDATVVERRWQSWKPWAVIGAGLAVGMAGAAIEWQAASRYDDFDRDWTDTCTTDPENPGCLVDEQPELIDDLSRARLENRVAIGAFVISGTSVLIGLAMLALNRPQSSRDESAGKADFTVEPILSEDSAGISTGFSF